jgi:hypothetical protein
MKNLSLIWKGISTFNMYEKNLDFFHRNTIGFNLH